MSVIDTSTDDVIATSPINGSPLALGVAPPGNVYVDVYNSVMSILSLVTASG